MSIPLPTGRAAIAQATDLADGQGRRFEVGKGPTRLDGVVVRFAGRFYAYVNRCKHMPMPLDLVHNHFFTGNKKYMRCQSHGATYDPATGRCLAGPCRGKRLDPLPIAVEGGTIYYAGPDESTT